MKITTHTIRGYTCDAMTWQVGDRVRDKPAERWGTIIERKQSGRNTVVFRIQWDDPYDDSFRVA